MKCSRRRVVSSAKGAAVSADMAGFRSGGGGHGRPRPVMLFEVREDPCDKLPPVPGGNALIVVRGISARMQQDRQKRLGILTDALQQKITGLTRALLEQSKRLCIDDVRQGNAAGLPAAMLCAKKNGEMLQEFAEERSAFAKRRVNDRGSHRHAVHRSRDTSRVER